MIKTKMRKIIIENIYRSSKMLINDISHLDLNTITDADAVYVNKCISDNKLSFESVKTVILATSNL